MSVLDVVRALEQRGETLAVAESLTGGRLAATLAEVPGVSAVFRGGLVVYATDLKASLAGVPDDLLAERGPVDPDVAAAMATGAREVCLATWGLGTTGVAGPDPQDGQPPGTVYIACAWRDGVVVEHLALDGNRIAIQRETVNAALQLLTRSISQRAEYEAGVPEALADPW